MRLLLRSIPALLAVALVGTPVLAQSQDPSFRLNNNTGVTINEVYVSSSNDNSWGSDRLGQNVLPPGQSLNIRLPRAQCMNDVRIVYANGQSQERRRVDTCQLTDLNAR